MLNGVLSALLFAGLVLAPGSPGNRGEPASDHPLHVSYGRMVLEGDAAILNVRIFTDDLEAALREFHGVEGIRMRVDPYLDSLFTSYFNASFTLTIADSVVPGVIVESGEQDDMWWYLVLFQGWQPIDEISFRTELLYNIFDDQRNIMRILHTATEEYQMYYSVAGAPETHVFSVRS
jgi:hypothetical protein